MRRIQAANSPLSPCAWHSVPRTTCRRLAISTPMGRMIWPCFARRPPGLSIDRVRSRPVSWILSRSASCGGAPCPCQANGPVPAGTPGPGSVRYPDESLGLIVESSIVDRTSRYALPGGMGRADRGTLARRRQRRDWPAGRRRLWVERFHGSNLNSAVAKASKDNGGVWQTPREAQFTRAVRTELDERILDATEDRARNKVLALRCDRWRCRPVASKWRCAWNTITGSKSGM